MNNSTGFGILCLVFATLFWSFAGLFVKYFSLQALDADVQNLFRYASATVGLWLLVGVRFGREALEAWRRWRSFLLPIAFNCVFQVAMVAGLYRKSIYPAFTSLVSKSSVLFSVVLAFIFFRDERRTVLSVRYLVGSLLAAAGVVGVVMFGERAAADFDEGVALVIFSAFLWACYTLAMKRAVRETRPVIAFAVVATFTTCFFVLLAAVRSRPSQFLELPWRDKGLVLFSGLICISAAHSLYFRAVERLGVAVCASFLLIQPLMTGVLSWLLLGESLRPAQIMMGMVLLAGAYMVITGRGPALSDRAT